ncbi:hypothetical protein DN388_22305 [Pseudomonas sp. S12(2018)]|nr:hypothetical protein [Pseudomonas sp. S12(2018)]
MLTAVSDKVKVMAVPYTHMHRKARSVFAQQGAGDVFWLSNGAQPRKRLAIDLQKTGRHELEK